jgi:hypothetical protein
MPRHKKGTLVRVKESALERNPFSNVNAAYVEDHGYLWIVEGWKEDSGYYECKSLATGKTGVGWLTREITTGSK